jgi:SAM-dependent methyltransferase
MPHTPRRYDLVDRLCGPHEAQWQLVAQAGIGPTASVVEIGSGTGNVTLRIARAHPGATVTGIDPDSASVARAREKAARAGLGIRFEEGRAGRLPLADGSVDRVMSSLMFHHLDGEERLTALQEVRRVLVPGGSLHVMDLSEGAPLSTGLLLRLVLGPLGHGDRHGSGRGHGHGDHAAAGHGHGHGAGDRTEDDVVELMAGAGLSAPHVVTRTTSRLGALTFYRAER